MNLPVRRLHSKDKRELLKPQDNCTANQVCTRCHRYVWGGNESKEVESSLLLEEGDWREGGEAGNTTAACNR